MPSPSALVVLLGATALGRTTCGITLVIGYGVGMAGTLTLAGLLLVRLRDRLGAGLRADRSARRSSSCASESASPPGPPPALGDGAIKSEH
ncbi:hypothetical protein [Streptomyces sp. NPDC051684]|uniref:hypothetical protein n=1 Tax=Streptomyces sp. NPDC051684 TaxID=3365670 RepID=UPI0037B15A94